jgi:hypothetical protein
LFTENAELYKERRGKRFCRDIYESAIELFFTPPIFFDVLNSFLELSCAADFSLLNLPKEKSLGRSKPATSSYAQAPQHTVWDDSYYIQALLNCLL